ncbi:P-loop containing nucleoside triphosphate hydrolase protein [Tricharina praecox]|uniref:P-loop containing nucleoside triphosphate hydrolase protein n=1 Tax=Tricharina praecox TaxID=43433 RepID=UPI0022207EC3|nr:P-loop containing nucleoside triphosphate hydrolase protein [Tricharina praecox]KAI5854058.1 P-loop containing nucleoside triphosphate hydrolase protein [Tricharina praecox]
MPVVNGNGPATGTQPPRVRASKLEFKRLDHLYNKAIHDFYLAESSRNSDDKDDKWEEFVFIVRRRFDWQNKFQNTVIDIKSPEITAVLREILKDVERVSLHEEKPSIDPSLLFNYHKDIKKVLEDEEALPAESQNRARIEHLTLLNNYIDADYASVKQRLDPLLEHGEITFDLLWAFFLPNTLCYTKCGGSTEAMCLKLDWVSEKCSPARGKCLSMECHYVDYDGRNFGECKAIVEIPEFLGTCRIDSLPIYPFGYHPDVDSLKQKLVARGRKFGTLTGMQYKYYKGLAFFKKKNSLVRVTVQSRIMVDALTFKRMNPNYNSNPVKPGAGRYGGGDPEDDLDDMGVLDLTAPNSSSEGLMSEEQLLMCSPTVLGFSFGDKMWVEFAIDSIHEIIFNTGAFDSLVLPESQKSIVRALVENHTGKGKTEKKRPGIDDIIRGKGQGLVAVLHGRPGVGKTLTAEGISEYLRKPLYMVSAGELGTDSRELEHQLSRILDICYGWGAVLLLDEADVFLERRSVHELQRNALVSIFLRLLEYFQGIMFLTTNRVETFDEAFQSRIHIALKYNDLDRKAKRIIWGTFLDMKKKNADIQLRKIVTEAELDGLARHKLNGRQIKNVVRTAQALSSSMEEALSMKHLTRVLEVTQDFEHDLKGTGQIESMMSYA